jgi:fatty acid/phospholipid biosynthesis enzyme
VVVCDGFVGNILLKSSEGLATMIAARIEALFKKTCFPRGGCFGPAIDEASAGGPGAGAA